MLDETGSAEAALDALPQVARDAGLRDYEICTAETVSAELRAGKAAGARLISALDPAYPEALKHIPDAPPLLWCLGNPDLLQKPLVGVAGARNVSSLGTRMARKMALGLANAGIVVVSGLARGVDAEAHTAALEDGTIAVLPCGVDLAVPPENTALARDIAAKGLLISERPLGARPHTSHFVARNRIITGLSAGLVVIEAAAKSGSMGAARTALDQGREIMAVPGHPFDARSAGSNILLRDGATLVRDAQDVIEHLGLPANAPLPADPVRTSHEPGPARFRQAPHETPQPAASPKPAKAVEPPPVVVSAAAPGRRGLSETAKLHQQILDRVAEEPVAEDQLIRDLQAPSQKVAPVIVDLELEGRIVRIGGGKLAGV